MPKYQPNLADIEAIACVAYEAHRAPWQPPWDMASEADRAAMALDVEVIVDNAAADPEVVHPPNLQRIKPTVLATLRAICEAAENLLEQLT